MSFLCVENKTNSRVYCYILYFVFFVCVIPIFITVLSKFVVIFSYVYYVLHKLETFCSLTELPNQKIKPYLYYYLNRNSGQNVMKQTAYYQKYCSIETQHSNESNKRIILDTRSPFYFNTTGNTFQFLTTRIEEK